MSYQSNKRPPTTRVWEDPRPGEQYVLGADSCSGQSTDESTIEICKMYLGYLVQVCEFYGVIDPDLFADLIVQYAIHYNSAFCVIENNSFGLAVNASVARRYDNVYRTEEFSQVEQRVTQRLGFNTNKATRSQLLFDFKRFMRIRSDTKRPGVVIWSQALYDQLETFVRNEHKDRHGAVSGYKIAASGGSRDDLVIAMGLCVQGVKFLDQDVKEESEAEAKYKNLSPRDRELWKEVHRKINGRKDSEANCQTVTMAEFEEGREIPWGESAEDAREQKQEALWESSLSLV